MKIVSYSEQALGSTESDNIKNLPEPSLTFSKASSVFSGLAFRAWDASIMGIGMKRIVKFLLEKKESNHMRLPPPSNKSSVSCKLKYCSGLCCADKTLQYEGFNMAKAEAK